MPPNTSTSLNFPPIFRDKSGFNIMHYNLAYHEIAHAVQVKPLLNLCWIGT